MMRAVVHDEVVFSVPADRFDEVRDIVLESFTFDWAPPGKSRRVPITCGAEKPGASWGKVYDKGSK